MKDETRSHYTIVIPAKAGIQIVYKPLDTCLSRYDRSKRHVWAGYEMA